MTTRTTRSALPVGAALLLSTLSSGTALAQTRELASGGELLDGVAAVVDEGVVLKSELAERLRIVYANIEAQNRQLPPQRRIEAPPLSVLEPQVLDQLVLTEIQLQRARRLGINVSDDALNQAIGNVARNLGLTLEQMPAQLASDGIDYTSYREDMRDDLTLRALEQRDVVANISVTPRELDDCLIRHQSTETDEFDYNVSHILIGTPSSSESNAVETARETVELILGELEAGTDFAELALQYSTAQTALEGGALGWRKGSELPTLFADVVPQLEPGEVSEPIQSGSGFHLVRLNEMRGAERIMVDQVRIRHILVTPNEILDSDAVEQRVRQIREQIAGGDDFGTVAINVSDDPGSAAEGGDLGWAALDNYVPEFADEIRELEPNELSEPFQTRYGWHIAEVLGRRAHDSTDEAQQQQCMAEIRESKAEEERELWLRRLRDQAFVDIRL